MSTPTNRSPLILVRGEATEEEVAALVAVLQSHALSHAAKSAAASAGSVDTPPASQWGSPYRKVRASYPHGAGGWRASALPR